MHHTNRTKTAPDNQFREMDRAYGTERDVGRFNPGLKSGATKSVMPNGIFRLNNDDEFKNGFH